MRAQYCNNIVWYWIIKIGDQAFKVSTKPTIQMIPTIPDDTQQCLNARIPKYFC